MQKIRMLDIETGSLCSRAVVWQIGFCDFTIFHDENTAGIQVESHGVFNMKFISGRIVDSDTIDFMVKNGTSVEFYAVRDSSNGMVAKDHWAYREITTWAQWLEWQRKMEADRRICAKWIHFDVPMIGASLEACGLPFRAQGGPWRHTNTLCLGTIQNEYLDADRGRDMTPLHKYVAKLMSRLHPGLAGKAHLAEHDAVYQAYLLHALRLAAAGEDLI